MSHPSTLAHRPTHRSFHRVVVALALFTGLFASACGGGGSEGGEETSGGETSAADATLDTSAPQGASVTVLFTAASLGEPDADPPRNTVGLTLTDETGTTVEVSLLELTGTCGAVEAAVGGFASFQCWWAGGGTKLHARAESGELVIYREELEEMSPEDPTQAVAIRRFSLASGASVTAAPVEP